MNPCFWVPFTSLWIKTTGTLATKVECYDVMDPESGFENCVTMIPMTCFTYYTCDEDCMNCTEWTTAPVDTMCTADGATCMEPMS